MKFLLGALFALLFSTAGLAQPSGSVPYTALPNCVDTGGQHLNVTRSTGAFACGTSGGSIIISTCYTTCTVTYNGSTASVRMIVMGGGGCGGGGAYQLSAGNVAPGGSGGGGGYRYDHTFFKTTLGASTTFTFGSPCTPGLGATTAGSAGGDGTDGPSVALSVPAVTVYGGGAGMGGSPGVFANATRGGGGASARGPGINGRTSGAAGTCSPASLYGCGTAGLANGSSPNVASSDAWSFGGGGGAGSTVTNSAGGGDALSCPGGGSGSPITAANAGDVGGFAGQAMWAVPTASAPASGATGANGADATPATIDFWGGSTAFGGSAGTNGNGGGAGGPGTVPCVGGPGGGAAAGTTVVAGPGGQGGRAVAYVIETLGTVPGCPNAATASADGCAAAKVALPQYPNQLKTYSFRPAWNVAGVDYGVGPADTQVFTDITVSRPACTSYNSGTHTLSITANNCTINGYDFRGGGGVSLSGGSFTGAIITNNIFGGPNYQALGTAPIDLRAGPATISYNIIDGGSIGGAENQAALIYIGGGAGTLITVTYNWFKNPANQIFDPSVGVSIAYSFNLIDNFARIETSGHQNYLQWISGTVNAVTVSYNFSRQTAVASGEGYQIYFNVSGTFASPIVTNNTLVVTGTNSMSYMMHGGTVTTGTNTNNYFDLTGAQGGAYYPSTMTPAQGWTSSGNTNMITGATIVPP